MARKDNSEPSAPLRSFAGLRVLEIGSWLAAPNAAAMLADLGAEVIKIESGNGDPVRRFPGLVRGNPVESAAFALLNRNKKSVRLDIGAEGRVPLKTLLSSADVLITNLRRSQLEKLNLNPQDLEARYPRLIIASLSGMGLRGPDADGPGFDVGVFWARSGLLNQITEDGAAPATLAGGYGDTLTALSLFSAIVVALNERQVTGKGGTVETSLLQTAAFALGGDLVSQQAYGSTPRARNRSKSRTPLNNSYRTSDGRWLLLNCVEAARFLGPVAQAIGRPELTDDPRFNSPAAMGKNAAELIVLLDEAFAGAPLRDWCDRLSEHGIHWEKMATPAELLEDPQVAANEMTSELPWGAGVLRTVISPFTIFRRRMARLAPAPECGADTEQVLGLADLNS